MKTVKEGEGLMFVNKKNDDKKKTPVDIEKVVCFKCHKLGHYA